MYLQNFPACCGANILTDLYGLTSGKQVCSFLQAAEAKEDEGRTIFAVTNQEQDTSERALAKAGFLHIFSFGGNYNNNLLKLWARVPAGRHRKRQPKLPAQNSPQPAPKRRKR